MSFAKIIDISKFVDLIETDPEEADRITRTFFSDDDVEEISKEIEKLITQENATCNSKDSSSIQ